jgi:hypothetical protein
MSARVRLILETRWEIVGKSTEGWLWPAPTKAEHVDHSSLKKQHTRAFRLINAGIEERNKRSGTKERESKLLLELRQNVETKGKDWCARRDSNSQPNAPEAFALSS